MRFRERGLVIGAVAMAGALTLTACGSGSSGDSGTASGNAGGAYSIGSEQPQDLIPSNCYDLYCANILQGVFTGLFTFKTEGTTMKAVTTELVKSISTADNGKTYTIVINSGNQFTNGEAVTAKTFVDTWNFAANGGNGQQLGFVFGPTQLNVVGYDRVAGTKSTTGKMAGLKAVDDTTIEIALAQPMGQTLFENYLAGPQILPMPSAAFADIVAYGKQPIGNGPYKFKGPWSTTSADIVKNADYPYTPGLADEINFRFYADNNAQWADLQANTLDVNYNMPQQALATAATVLGDRFINIPAMSFSYEAYPTQVEAFKDRDVRVALAKAVDWAEISTKLYFGTRTAATGFAPATVTGGGRDVCGDDCKFDPAAAKALLEKAGGLPGNKVQLGGLANSTNEALKAECNMIQKNLGVACEVKVFEGFGPMLDAFQKLSADDEGFILGLGWGADNPTLANMIAPIFGTDAGTNYAKYSNAEFDKLIAEGNQAADEATAVAKWQAAEDVLYEDFAGHAIQWRNNVGGYSTNVSNVQINPGG
ncbi:MAG: ABC transporter substrate-binding protein, partial [Propionicimonas sp.]